MLDSKPVKFALEQVVGLTDRKDKFAIFSYYEDFNTLWRVSDESFHGLEDIVVIWDDIPSGTTVSVNTSLYLTPIDWAVAFSLTACKRKDKPNFRITIIDLNSDSSASAPAVRFINQFPKRDIMSMPWIRVVRPILPPVDKDGLARDERDIKDVIADLLTFTDNNDFKSIEQTYAANSSHDVEVVKSVWRANLVKTPNPDDNHAIANLLGPMLLAGSDLADNIMEDTTKVKPPQDNITALRNLMKSLGLYPSDSKTTPENDTADSLGAVGSEHNETNTYPLAEKPSQVISDDNADQATHAGKKTLSWSGLAEKLKHNRTKLLLMDDQWEDGWGRALCHLMGVKFSDPGEKVTGTDSFVPICEDNGFVIKVSSTPDWLMSNAEGATKKAPLDNIGDGKKFKLALDDTDERDEILLLDLRLFTGSDIARELSFIEKLSSFAKEIQSKKLKTWNLSSWEDGLGEIHEISNWIPSGAYKKNNTELRNDPRYHKALTLLPRIIAEIDMSYPVIIFSSTGRREISKLFDGYENLLTEFEKPRFNGLMTMDAVEESREKLLQMLVKACAIIDAKKGVNRLLTTSFDSLFSDQETKPRHVHVELYIDEHHPDNRKTDESRNNIRVGGCYAVFTGDNKDEALTKAYAFDDALVSNGYFFFSRGNYPPNILTGQLVKAKNDEAVEPLKSALESEHKPYKIVPVRISRIVNPKVDVTGDQAYREAISSLIEFFVYELLPHVASEVANKISYSIYAGTRVTPHYDFDFIQKLSYKYGLFIIEDGTKLLLESLTPSTLFPIIDDLRNYRGTFIEHERAIGIPIIYDLDGKSSCKSDGRLICRKCKVSVKEKIHKNKYSKIIWSNSEICPKCKRNDNLHIDYPAGVYIADQIMNKSFTEGNYSDFIKFNSWGFDEPLDDFLVDAREAGRSIDNGNKVRAVWLALRAFSGTNSNLLTIILSRIHPHIFTMSGTDFHLLSEALSKNSIPTDYALSVKKNISVPYSPPQNKLSKTVVKSPTNSLRNIQQPVNNPSVSTPKQKAPIWSDKLISTERITVTNLIGKIPECTRKNGGICNVTFTQYSKINKPDIEKITIGTILVADIFESHGKITARNIKLSETISESTADCAPVNGINAPSECLAPLPITPLSSIIGVATDSSAGIQAIDIERREQITVAFIVEPHRLYANLHCRSGNNEFVVVSPKAMEAAGIGTADIKVGSKLEVTLNVINGMLQGCDLKLAE